MKEYKVQSSNIKSIGYDTETQKLKVTFGSGASYFYEGVPADLVCGLLFSESVGKFFSDSIKKQFEGIKEHE